MDFSTNEAAHEDRHNAALAARGLAEVYRRPAVTAHEHETDAGEPVGVDAPLRELAPGEAPGHDMAEAEAGRPVPARRAEAPSPDLIDTYFRHMGGGELLTREAEVALAKRIEAGELALIEALTRVPLVLERIAHWEGELREARLPVRDLIDMRMFGAEPAPGAPGSGRRRRPRVAPPPRRRMTTTRLPAPATASFGPRSPRVLPPSPRWRTTSRRWAVLRSP